MPVKHLRAIVVEDDKSWQQILGEILFDCGLVVEFADNIEDTILLLKKNPHRVAVVDLSLSPNDHTNIDGLHVLDTIRKLDPNCRSILLTGFATVELAVTSISDYGAFTFLRKENFNRGQFRDLVNRILISPPVQAAPQQDPVSSLRTQSQNKPSRQMNKQGGKALVVEDDAGWRSILGELLSEEGFQVLSCASFGEAFGLIQKERISLAVIDLSLQGVLNPKSLMKNMNKDGYQLLATTHKENIPAIVVSGLAEPDEIQRVYKEFGITTYIEKHTFDRSAFRKAVKEASSITRSRDELRALTDREREVLVLLAQGLTNKEIAQNLVITTNTVKRHLKAIFEKLDVHTRSAATAKIAGER